MSNFNFLFDENQFLRENAKYFAQGEGFSHPEFNLTKQGTLLRAYPHLADKLKAAGESETRLCKVALDKLKADEQDLLEKFTVVRGKIAKLQSRRP